MPFIEILKQTLAALWSQKLRSFLTMFGIVWGITSVILLVGLGIGFNRDQKQRMHGLGIDIAIIWGGKTGAQAGGYAAGREVRLLAEDADAIKQQCILIKGVSPELSHNVAEVSQYNAANASVHGVWPEYQEFRNLHVAEGRQLTDEDERGGARVALLGDKIRQQLFPGKAALNQTLMLNGIPYTVVGLLPDKKQNGSYGGRDFDLIFVPFSAMERDLPPVQQAAQQVAVDPNAGYERGQINNLVVQPVNPASHEAALREVYRVLGERHHFNADDKEALEIWDTLEGAELSDHIFGAMTWFFGVVAVLTLALGGIGVMNIMLIAVTERTREIGVRKALGARDKDIERQFLAESAIITLMSGGAGLLLGVGTCIAAQHIPLPDFVPHPVISTAAITASLATLALITVFAGTYPARRARELSPMDCLRTE